MPDKKPIFFFSHSRQTREAPGSYLRKFYEDLHFRVAEAAQHSLNDDGPLGVIDASGVEWGADWEETLGGAVATVNVLLAVITPTYFERKNCGREVGEFLRRSASLGIDPRGQLTGVENLFVVRWYEPYFYNNQEPNGRIPCLIRRVSDALPSPDNNAKNMLLTNAVQFYRDYGMELCVDHEPDYRVLLNYMAYKIVNARPLAPGAWSNWNDAIDAFRYDWAAYFNAHRTSAAGGMAAPLLPLKSVVMFYVTDRAVTVSAIRAAYADMLLEEPISDQLPEGTDRAIGDLLIDMRNASQQESFEIVHCAPDRNVALTAEPIIDRLSTLSRQKVLAALVIDPDVLRGTALAVLREVAESSTWHGPVLLPCFEAGVALNSAGLNPQRRMMVTLPPDRNARRDTVTGILLNLRREIARNAGPGPGAAKAFPQLQSAGASSR